MSVVPPRPDARTSARATPGRGLVALVSAIFTAGAAAAVAIVIASPPSPIVGAGSTPHPTSSVDRTEVPTDPDGPYAFLEATYVDGERTPVRWNPCQPLEFQVHLEQAPPGTRAAIDNAVAASSTATGIPFVSGGPTPRRAWALRAHGFFANPLRSVYHPVLIDVVTHREFLRYGEPRRVLAFAHPERGTSLLDDQYVAGYVVLDGGARFAASGRWSMTLVLQHELGHLLGLAHVSALDELMFSVEVAHHTYPDPIDGWGPGDLQGLERLGADQGCLRHVSVGR